MASRKEQKEQLREQRLAAQQKAAASANTKRRGMIIGGVLGTALVIVAIVIAVSVASTNSKKVTGASDVNARFAGIPQEGITLGDAKAPVTFVEFGDLKCPYCGEFARDALPTIVKDYIKTGKVKMIFRNLRFVGQPESDTRRAAAMAAAVGQQNKLFQFIDLFYVNQKDESIEYVTDAYLRKLAGAIPGVNVPKAMTARNSDAVESQLKAAENLDNENGSPGTPNFMYAKSGQPLQRLTISDFKNPSEFATAFDSLQP